MKFVALALLSVVSAVRVHQAHAPTAHTLVQSRLHAKAHPKAHALAKILKKPKHKACPSAEDKEMAEAWFAEQMSDEEAAITKEEGAAAIAAYAESKGHEISEAEWAQLEEAFDEVDTDDNGALDADELAAVEEQAAKEYKKACGEDW